MKILLLPLKVITGVLIYLYLFLAFDYYTSIALLRSGYQVMESFFVNPLLGILRLFFYLIEFIVLPFDIIFFLIVSIPDSIKLTNELFENSDKVEILKKASINRSRSR